MTLWFGEMNFIDRWDFLLAGCWKSAFWWENDLENTGISSFRRKPDESRNPEHFLKYLIFKTKQWTPAFAGVTPQLVY